MSLLFFLLIFFIGMVSCENLEVPTEIVDNQNESVDDKSSSSYKPFRKSSRKRRRSNSEDPDDICDTKEVIQSAIFTALNIDSTDCSAVTLDQLDAIEDIRIVRRDRDNELSFEDFSIFSEIKRLFLMRLNLNIESIFPYLDNLTDLSLVGNNFSNSLLSDVFTNLPALKTLNLSDNNLTSLPDNIFSGLENLETLDLSDNELRSPIGLFYRNLPSSLKTIDLSNNIGIILGDINKIKQALPPNTRVVANQP